MELMDQTAVITGGTAGIGQESARLLASEGATVIISGRDRVRGEQAVEADRCERTVRSDRHGRRRVGEFACAAVWRGRHHRQQCRQLSVRVDCRAGPGRRSRRCSTPMFAALTSWSPAWFRGCCRRGRGSIVNVTTMAAFKGIPGASGYSASKAALESLTRTWAAEFGAAGVRVEQRGTRPHPHAWGGRRMGRRQRGARAGATARSHRVRVRDRRGRAFPQLPSGQLHHRLHSACRRRRRGRLGRVTILGQRLRSG